MLSIIVAISENYAIGKNNDLLCRISADLKRFKALTTGHTVIMGRNTYLSLPNGALPNRHNIVVSRTMHDADDRIEIASSLEEAIQMCNDEDEVFVIGGAQIYKRAIGMADRLYITWIHHAFDDADVFFPAIEMEEWTEVSRERHAADERNEYDYSFVEYRRK